MAKSSVKKRYIEAATKLIQEEGMEAVSARRLSAMIGMNVANIYRHFENMDELCLYASMSIFQDYQLEMQRMMAEIPNRYELLVTSWEVYIEYAFRDVLLYDRLFFGKEQNKIAYIFQDYYRLYPEQKLVTDDIQLLYSSDYTERNRIMLESCCEQGHFRYEDVDILNAVSEHMLIGYLRKATNILDQPEEVKKLRDELIRYETEFFEKYRLT